MSVLDDHFQNPRNAGKLEDAHVHVEAENPVCGDILHLYLRLDARGAVDIARFQAYGCPAAIAAGSLLTEALAGKTARELEALDAAAIAEALGGLSAEKYHAAQLAADAVRKAAARWEDRG